MSEADRIAAAVLEQFDRLPAKRKPVVRDNGAHEWVPLSGIVARLDGDRYECLSLATGMKCLPASKLPQANGIGLHDWHAEVLAIRAFNRFVLQECRDVAALGRPSEFVRLRPVAEQAAGPADAQPFVWREGVALHMYCSEAPCGDASMELTMAAQEDASPWEVPAPLAGDSNADEPATSSTNRTLPGRAYFSQLGVVRRKPARGDAPPTASKSCSDKLALRQCTSLLSSAAALLISPRGVFLASLVLPTSQRSETGCRRAFSADDDSDHKLEDVPGTGKTRGPGRMRDLAGRTWPGGYAFVAFRVDATDREFALSKRSAASRSSRGSASGEAKTTASNLSAAWTRHGLEEGLIGGVLQGRKPFDPRGASALSRRALWGLAREVAGLPAVGRADVLLALGGSGGEDTNGSVEKRYRDVKECALLATRSAVKREVKAVALRGWVDNEGDDGFCLEGDRRVS